MLPVPCLPACARRLLRVCSMAPVFGWRSTGSAARSKRSFAGRSGIRCVPSSMPPESFFTRISAALRWARLRSTHILETAGEYSNLEFEVEAGVRGKRDVHVDRLFRKLLDEDAGPDQRPKGAPSGGSVSTIVVNNNAAAVLLALNSLAEGGEVIVSRGELVEIGGSFRIPDVMAKSGATLREVGTTNRTRIADYESAINERTRLLLRVHRSNFEITGFTEQPSPAEMVALARKRGCALHGRSGQRSARGLAEFRHRRRTQCARQPARWRRCGHLQRRQTPGRTAIRADQRPRRSGRAHADQFSLSRAAGR